MLKTVELTLFFFILSVCAPASAQDYYSGNNGPMSDSLVRSSRVAQLDIYTVYKGKRSESTSRRTYLYDQDGRQIFNASIYDTLKQKKMRYATNHVYAGGGKQGSVYYYGEGRYSYFRLTDYNHAGRVSGYRYFSNRGRLSSYSVYAYKDSNLYKIENYKRSGKRKSYYEYVYEGRKVTKYGLYSNKGKLKRLWDYTCADNAPAVKRLKDTVKVCTVKSYRADGTVLITTTTFNYRGEPVKYLELQDSLKRKLSYLTYTGIHEVLTYRQLYMYTGNVYASTYVWNGDNKGRPYYAYTRTFSPSGQITSETDSMFQYKTPRIMSYTFEFDSAGMLTRKTGQVDGRVKNIEFYKYRYYRKD